MAGYTYRDPSRAANQPVFTATDKRVHELEQENAQLRDRMTKFESLANQWGKEKRAALEKVKQLELELAVPEKTTEALKALRQRVLELRTERTQAMEEISGRVEANHGRVRALLGTLRTERQELAGERSRRQHAETFLSRSDQRTDNVRDLLGKERDQYAAEVRDFQATIAGLEETIGELRARLAQRHDVVTETRVKQLEGALADQQRITADRTRERDMARGQAIAAWATVDRTHTLLTRNQLNVFEAKRLARSWGIDFEQPEGEVA